MRIEGDKRATCRVHRKLGRKPRDRGQERSYDLESQDE
jgi:hypothetical protein